MLAVSTRLRFGAYDAGRSDDARLPEWPPHPARIFCALVASGPSKAEWEALRWLERQPPPILIAPALLGGTSKVQFVPTNEVTAASPNLPGRKNAARTKPRALPAGDHFTLIWEDANPNDATVLALDGLARRVPYVGRATSSAEVVVSTETSIHDQPEMETFEPAVEGADRDLRVPYAGYCRELEERFEDGRRAWEAERSHGYRLRRPPGPEAPEAPESPFSRLLIFEFVGSSHLHASLTAQVTEALRSAVMDLVDDPLPVAVSGHGDGPKLAYLALPNVGHPGLLPDGPRFLRGQNPHADGRVLAVAIAVPRSEDDLALALYRALVERGKDGLRHLALGSAGRPEVAYRALRSDRWGATPVRWTRPSAYWATATPLVFDRFPKGRSPAIMVTAALMTAGYPEPLRVVAHRSPILPGAPQLSRSQVRRRAGVPVKPWVHAWVQFAEPQRGPVLAGSMRHRGLGLFVPIEVPDGGTAAAADGS